VLDDILIGETHFVFYIHFQSDYFSKEQRVYFNTLIVFLATPIAFNLFDNMQACLSEGFWLEKHSFLL
jgi:hypothetical protein